MICYFMIPLLLIHPNSTRETSIKSEDDELYKLISTDDSPGLQYKVVGKAKLYKSSWTINTYFDLKYLYNSLDINKSMLKSIKMYVNISNISKIFTLRLKKHVIELEKEIGVIIKQLSEHNKGVKRSFEYGGSALKWIFGIADADDVRRYDSSINKMEKDKGQVLRIVHDQISI